MERQAGRVFCIGQAHNCSIDLASVSSVVIDRTARMKDMVLPKLEFQNAVEEKLVMSLLWAELPDTTFVIVAHREPLGLGPVRNVPLGIGLG